MARKLSFKKIRLWLLCLIILGSLTKFYGLTFPWARKDHYNYGGIHSSKMAECLAKTPLSVSKGIPHNICDPEPGHFYPNHPPTFLFALNAWKALWNSTAEWTYRSFVILFSLINVFLVFQIASLLGTARKPYEAWFPYLAAAVQSLTIGGQYFASHPDFICEFAVFFPLLATYLHLRSREHAAGLVTVAGGLASWPGLLFFGGQFLHHWLQKKKLWRVVLWGLVGSVSGLLLMMWLHQTMDIGEFIKHKLSRPGYVEEGQWDLLYPYRWWETFWVYHANYLSPLFVIMLVLELVATTVNREWKKPLISFVALMGGGGIIYSLLGHEYVYIHAFLYLYLFPLYSIFIARWVQRCVTAPESLKKLVRHPRWISFGVFVLLLHYPWGRLQSNLFHDVCNSLGLLSTTVAFTYLFLKSRLNLKRILVLITIAGITNISQMINYRNEPKKDWEFCQKAREEYARTGQPVVSPLDAHFTRDYYCKGIPLIEAK